MANLLITNINVAKPYSMYDFQHLYLIFLPEMPIEVLMN